MVGFIQAITENAKSNAADIRNIYSARQAEENQRRDIRAKERMAKMKYQWQTEDLKKAGLNPMLAVAQGAGGQAAGGSASGGQLVSEGSSNVGSAFAKDQELRQLQKVQTAQINKITSEENLNNQQSAESAARERQLKRENDLTERLYRELYPQTDLGTGALILDRSQTSAGAAAGAANLAKRLAEKASKAAAEAAKKKAAEAAKKGVPKWQPNKSQLRKNARKKK